MFRLGKNFKSTIGLLSWCITGSMEKVKFRELGQEQHANDSFLWAQEPILKTLEWT